MHPFLARAAGALSFAAALAGMAPAAAAPAAAATTAPSIKPGLWEMQHRVGSADRQVQAAMADMQKQLASMPPERRLALQQMLEQNGVQMNLGAGGALTSRVCITSDMVERKEFPIQQGDCRQTVTQQAPGRMRVAFECSKPPASGEGELTLDSDTSYRARMHVKGGGRQQSVDVDLAGKWLGADCGALRR